VDQIETDSAGDPDIWASATTDLMLGGSWRPSQELDKVRVFDANARAREPWNPQWAIADRA
jgi:hypothetical protein